MNVRRGESLLHVFSLLKSYFPLFFSVSSRPWLCHLSFASLIYVGTAAPCSSSQSVANGIPAVSLSPCAPQHPHLTWGDWIPCCGALTHKSPKHKHTVTFQVEHTPNWSLSVPPENFCAVKRRCVNVCCPHRAEVATYCQGRCCDLSIVVLPFIRSLLPLYLSSPHQLVPDALECGNTHTHLRTTNTHLPYSQVLTETSV